jgi:hypothetical protein
MGVSVEEVVRRPRPRGRIWSNVDRTVVDGTVDIDARESRRVSVGLPDRDAGDR